MCKKDNSKVNPVKNTERNILQSDGDINAEVNKRQSVDGTTGGRWQVSYATGGYQHTVR